MSFFKKYRSKVALATALSITALVSLPAAAQISEVRGGHTTKDNEFKAIAAVGIIDSTSGNFLFLQLCTGTLVSPTRVLTGVKCLRRDTVGRLWSTRVPLFVLFPKDFRMPHTVLWNGDNQFRSLKEIADAGFIVREVKRENMLPHPSFKISRGDNGENFTQENYSDIMVLKLSKPVNSIKPIHVANKKTVDSLKSGDELKAVGYGSGHNRGIYNYLKQATVNYYPKSQCRNLAKKTGEAHLIKNDGICARDDNPDLRPNGFCALDEGAPLLRYNKSKSRHEIVGLFSVNVGDDICKNVGAAFSVKPTSYAAWVDSTLNMGYSIK